MARRKNKRRKASKKTSAKLQRLASATVAELKQSGSITRTNVIPQGSAYKPAPRGKERGRTHGAVLRPAQLSRIIRAVECGDPNGLVEWADLSEKILRDPHIKSVYDTRVMGVSGSPMTVEPGIPGDALAEQAAELFRESIMEKTTNVARACTQLLHGGGVGWSALEHDWQYLDGAWHSVCLRAIASRDIAFDDDYTPHVRTYDVEGEIPASRGFRSLTLAQSHHISLMDERDRWVWHKADGMASVPTMTGYLLGVAWPWLFKQWATVYRQDVLERFASPRSVLYVEPNTPSDVREYAKDCLEEWGATGVGVFENTQRFELVEAITGPDHWTTAIDKLNAELSKAILGSTLNVEIDKAGGNRAAAESQAATTILPRLQADANSLAETLERDWAEPWCRFNPHLFGGVVPPTPRIRFQLTQDEPPEVDSLLIEAGAVTVNELRRSRGLEEWPPERGGDDIVNVQSNAEDALFSQLLAAPEEVAASVPKAQSVKALSKGASPTSSTSKTRVNLVPFDE